jgi:N-acetylglucosamine-6-phosphate deacetylase
MRLTLRGARLVDAEIDRPSGDITFEDGRIVAVGETVDLPSGRVVDVAGMIVMPGFIDIHTHGGGGWNLHTTAPDEIHSYARWVPRTGVTAFLVAIVGTPDELPEPQLRAAVTAIEQLRAGAEAEPLGIHLEGPYISAARRGAHPPSWLRRPDRAEMERILSLADGHLRLVTLAPELPGAHDVIRQLVAAGVTVSMGHTDATYEQALEAIALGVTHATHCCNAMRPLLHREPGPLGALALSPSVAGELIVDGVHVHPAMARVMIQLLGSDRTILITDAQAGAGGDASTFEFAGQQARIVDGAARLADGTLAGSVLTLDQALRNVCAYPGLSLSAASAMLSRNPARAVGAADRMGMLAPGSAADLVLLDADLTVCATFCEGAPVYASAEWSARLAPATETRRGRSRGQV